MEGKRFERDDVLPRPLISEYFVRMTCGSCVETMRKAVETLGEKETRVISVDEKQELVKIRGREPVENIIKALQEHGLETKLVAVSSDEAVDVVPKEFGSAEENTSCVSFFRGEMYGHGSIKGTVRITQVGARHSFADVNLAGLNPEEEIHVAVHSSGDVTDGANSVGRVYGMEKSGAIYECTEGKGYIGKGVADEKGEVRIRELKQDLNVWEIIGRATVVHSRFQGLAAAVVARSAMVGANPKKVCSCDGTVIWEAK